MLSIVVMAAAKVSQGACMNKKPAAFLIAVVLAAVTAFGGHFEGRRLVAYQDVANVWSLCDGHTKGVKPGDTATTEQCDAWLREEMGDALATVQRCIRTPLSLGQLVAFTDATYNLGPAVVCGSTLQRLANAGDLPGACNQLPRWNKAGGKVVAGLTQRREMERRICLGEPL
jgi:GH24 family phage-related lysozyme (muramidase)